MKLQPMSEAIGVEVTGLDLSRAITRDTRAALEAALAEHLVMVVRDQSLTPNSLLACEGCAGSAGGAFHTDVPRAPYNSDSNSAL